MRMNCWWPRERIRWGKFRWCTFRTQRCRLNMRLSDRASRITMQSFKMYLGKGIDDFTQLPVGPGRMWTSDNPDADVITFGGDSDNPAESLHIADLREALDKS